MTERSRSGGRAVALALIAAGIIFLLRLLTGGGGPERGDAPRGATREGENRLEAEFARKKELEQALASKTVSPSERKTLEGQLRTSQLRIDAACEDALAFAKSSLDTRNALAMQDALQRMRRVAPGASPALRAEMEGREREILAALRH